MNKSHPNAFVTKALASFETALKSQDGPLFPIQAEIAMLRSRYESERRKWDESLLLARSHDKTLHGDKESNGERPGVVNCLRNIRDTLDEHVKTTAQRETDRIARHNHLMKVFWSALITSVTTLAVGAIWLVVKLPVLPIKP